MKKIGEIKGVPVVEGDANLVKNQILYKETDKGISLSKRTNGKLEEVSGGSSQENTDDWYYYKFIIGEVIPGMAEAVVTFYSVSHNVYFLSKYYGGDDNITELPIISVVYNWESYPNKLINYCKFSKEKSLCYGLKDYSIEPLTWVEGDLIERLRKVLGDVEEVEQIIEAYSQSFVEISKEEYESLITYRVE